MSPEDKRNALAAAIILIGFAALFLGLSLLVVWQLGIGGALLGSHDLALVLLGIAATQVAADARIRVVALC